MVRVCVIMVGRFLFGGVVLMLDVQFTVRVLLRRFWRQENINSLHWLTPRVTIHSVWVLTFGGSSLSIDIPI